MSYEGRVQCICPNGHYYEVDALDSTSCRSCGARPEWKNHVDDTNGDAYGEILQEFIDKHLLVTPEKQERCNLGHYHTLTEALYRVPDDREMDRFRTYSKWQEDEKGGFEVRFLNGELYKK